MKAPHYITFRIACSFLSFCAIKKQEKRAFMFFKELSFVRVSAYLLFLCIEVIIYLLLQRIEAVKDNDTQ
jgi:hypothetical protein